MHLGTIWDPQGLILEPPGCRFRPRMSPQGAILEPSWRTQSPTAPSIGFLKWQLAFKFKTSSTGPLPQQLVYHRSLATAIGFPQVPCHSDWFSTGFLPQRLVYHRSFATAIAFPQKTTTSCHGYGAKLLRRATIVRTDFELEREYASD